MHSKPQALHDTYLDAVGDFGYQNENRLMAAAGHVDSQILPSIDQERLAFLMLPATGPPKMLCTKPKRQAQCC